MLSYDYVEYQHIKFHLFSGDDKWSSVLPRVINNTILHYSKRVIDIFFKNGRDAISTSLMTHNIRPQTLECYEMYFRTRFHLVESMNAKVPDDVWLHRLLQSIPNEQYETKVWLSSLLHPEPPTTFRNNPVRHLIAFRGNATLEDMQFTSRWLSKLQGYHYHTQSETNQITLPLSKRPEYLSFDNHTMTTLTMIRPILTMDEFVFETETMDIDMEQEQEQELTREEKEKNVRCIVVIRYGVRKGDTCNRICKSDRTSCGIHHYTSK